jgi:erythromycin esterase-like protein
MQHDAAENEFARSVVALDGSSRPYDRILANVGDARFVLLGEASHGTHEFYRERAHLTRRLIEECGFDAVAVEADWPDAWRVHRWIRGRGADRSASEALGGFTRFPQWMWRNADVELFAGWLHEHAPHVGFYGLDLYSLHASIDLVLGYLDRVDPEAAKRARARYACFDPFGRDADAYAHAAGLDLAPSCEREVTEQLLDMRARRMRGAREASSDADGDDEEEAELAFQADENARLVKDAEAYYRSMFRGAVVTWNLRDRHMVDTLASITEHLDRRLGRPCKIVVWAHNSHVGDARATEMRIIGETNVGELVRERYGRDAFLIGFTTYGGTVTAAIEWGERPRHMVLEPAIADSHELMLHEIAETLGSPNIVVLPRESPRVERALGKERLERALGVVYRVHTERESHWLRARLAEQFDAVIHIDRTSAVVPLDPLPEGTPEDLPDTYPFAV